MATTGDVSDLDELIYGGSPVLPEQNSYSVSIPGGVVRSDVDGGLPKSQLQFFNKPYTASVTYIGLDGFKIAYIENFFERNRGQKFIAYFLISSGEVEPFVCQFVGEPSFSKTGFNGSVQVSYEVQPGIDRCYQQSILALGQCLTGGQIVSIGTLLNEAIEAKPNG
ncbi:hypothetical protein [Vibrio phage LP.2]|nr:hypothetical protein [Vibrio phage LP.2]